MYRQYENPHDLEELLEQAKQKYEDAKLNDPDNTDELVDLYLEVYSLEDRVRFAYDDEEYEENYMRDYCIGEYASLEENYE